jgi:hypothetical protein
MTTRTELVDIRGVQLCQRVEPSFAECQPVDQRLVPVQACIVQHAVIDLPYSRLCKGCWTREKTINATGTRGNKRSEHMERRIITRGSGWEPRSNRQSGGRASP